MRTQVSRKKKHNWIGIGGMSFKCTACGVLRENRYLPREQKHKENRKVTEFFMNGVLLAEEPKCTIEY